MSYNLSGGWEYATTAVSGNDQNILAAGVAGEKIVVMVASGLVANVAAGTVSFNSDAVPIASITGVGMANGAVPTNYAMPYSPVGLFETVDGEDLILDSDTAAQFATATVTFIRVPA